MSSWWGKRARNLDWWIIASAVVLMSMGIVMLWSMATSADSSSADTFSYGRFQRQLATSIVALAIIILGAILIDLKTIEHFSRFFFILSLILLLLVLVWGTMIRGTRGWFVYGNWSIQPVEFAKAGFVLFFATLLQRWARRLSELKALFASGVGVVAVGALILLQPDFGSFFVVVSVWLMMILIIGLKRSHLAMMLVLAVVVSAVAWNLFQPYQRERLNVFLHPSQDPLGRGYQLRQSIIAVGSGGLFGKGLGYGSQSQLRFLPERQTDFLFAVIGEELGFIGITIVMILWGIILMRLLYWASVVTDDYALFVLLGIAMLLFSQSIIVIGMNIGLVPVTGLSLPLVSYGGSSLIATALLLMVAESIAIQSRMSGWAKKYQ